MSRNNQHYQNDPFDDDLDNFLSPFDQFENHFNNNWMNGFHQRMQQQFDEMNKIMNDPNFQMDDGKGQYYYSSTCTRTINGLSETKKQVKTNDYEEREQYKQIGDKRIHAKWNKNRKTGQEDFRRDAVNVQEDEIDSFNQEFNRQAQQFQDMWPQTYGLGYNNNKNKKVSNDKLLKGNQRNQQTN